MKPTQSAETRDACDICHEVMEPGTTAFRGDTERASLKGHVMCLLRMEVGRIVELEALLHEARDLLFHDDLHGKDGKPCPGCDLEARIDAVLHHQSDGNGEPR